MRIEFFMPPQWQRILRLYVWKNFHVPPMGKLNIMWNFTNMIMIYIMANTDMDYFDLERTRREISRQGIKLGILIGVCKNMQGV